MTAGAVEKSACMASRSNEDEYLEDRTTGISHALSPCVMLNHVQLPMAKYIIKIQQIQAHLRTLY